jgi:hypothetical protein
VVKGYAFKVSSEDALEPSESARQNVIRFFQLLAEIPLDATDHTATQKESATDFPKESN